jgi:hypothetical protein
MKAFKDNKKILHISWLEYCDIFFIQVNDEDFILSKEHPTIDYTKLGQVNVMNKNKEKINKFFACDEENYQIFLKAFQEKKEGSGVEEEKEINV